MDQNIQNQEEVIDLRQYFKVINKNKWRIVGFAFFISFFAAIISLKITPVYQATATLLIEAQEAKAVSFQEVYGLDSSQKEYYLTQFEILKSKAIAQQVIEKLDLANHPEFNKPPSFVSEIKSNLKKSIPFFPAKPKAEVSDAIADEYRIQSLISQFSRRLSISPIRKTQMVQISYRSEDAKLAALVANTVGEVYIQNHINAKMGITQQAAGWLTTRLSGLRVQLDESEANLQAYREQENLIDVEGVVGLIKKELEQTSSQLVIARNDQNKLESITRVIAEYGKSDYSRLESIPEITSHKVIQDVKREVIFAERKVSELSEVYGPKHPKMIAAISELNTVKANLSKQIKALVTGIEKEMRTAKANVVALEKALNRIRSQYQQVTRKETEYHKLKREVETNRNIYDAFLSRSKETEVTSDFSSAVARFTDRAFTPIAPIKPKKSLIIALAFMVSFGLAVVIAFVVEALNDTVKSSADIEQKLSQRMLGLLPLQQVEKGNNLDHHWFFNADAKQFSEAVRTFRTGFVLSQMDKKCDVIEVTSSVPGEGKTTTSSNLAFSLAQMEKVLLIDADMRKPSICRRFNIPNYHPGLANFIAGTDKFEDCLFVDEKSGLTIMPCGQVPPNPLELLSSKRFAAMIEELRSKFDKIVIDTAPTQAVSDSLVISQVVDAVIYVVKADSTRLGMVKTGLGRLIEARANVAGVVLNHVDMKKADSYGSYHGYYDYYGYSEDSKA